MEPAELDVQLEELEVRLERLRALYEQYFMGIEKLEPTIARKDVDRRIYVLRREKIRNTGKRFKLQTIIQRYNTFQQYWHRICREIENGTYRRHVLRAEKNFGPNELLTIAARRRFGKGAARAPEPEPARAEQESSPAPVAAEPEPAAPPPAPVAAAAKASPPPPPQRAAAQAPPPKRAGKPQQFESLDLDMDFLGDWDPAAAAKRASAKPSEPPARPAPPAKPSTRPLPRPALASAPPAAPAPKPVAAAPAAPAAPAPPAAAVPAPRVPPLQPPAPVRKPLPRAEPKPAAAAPAGAGPIDEARIRDLHGRLNELKRQNQEAGQVSLEGLAKTLRATEEKLRQQHAGRKIDFDVVVKDGKAVVKPIVR